MLPAREQEPATKSASEETMMLEASGRQAQIENAAVAPPCAMVIFGAAGDLTKRLVVPALYNLTTTRQLSDGFQLVGVDRAAKSTQEWRAGLTDTMKEFVGHEGKFQVERIDQKAWQWLGRSHELSAG